MDWRNFVIIQKLKSLQVGQKDLFDFIEALSNKDPEVAEKISNSFHKRLKNIEKKVKTRQA